MDFFDLVEADDSADEEGILRRNQIVDRDLVFDPEALPFKNGSIHSVKPVLSTQEVVPPLDAGECDVYPSSVATKTDVPAISTHPDETITKKRRRGESETSGSDIQIEATAFRS